MSETTILAEIDVVTKERNHAWAEGRPEVALTDRLDRLYADLRAERARMREGDRRSIKRRARIELGLEKLSDI